MQLCLRSIVRMTRSQARGRVSARAAPKEKPGTSTSALGVNRAKADKIRAQLQELYPNPPIPLVHRNVFELLCAVVLSAQCTDKKVNSVTGSLFEAAPDPEAMAELGEEKIKEKIKSLGLANNKAKFLVRLLRLRSLHFPRVAFGSLGSFRARSLRATMRSSLLPRRFCGTDSPSSLSSLSRYRLDWRASSSATMVGRFHRRCPSSKLCLAWGTRLRVLSCHKPLASPPFQSTRISIVWRQGGACPAGRA